ncbi:MAG: hypothetical protein MJA31_20880 [Clostridia bacterium]|nr:hypothetical protein [Clostridia bacterium]
MKKILMLLLVMAMVFSLAACGNDAPASEQEDNGSSSEETGESLAFFDETIKIIMPYGAGGTSDAVARKFAEVASKYTGKPLVVENLTGGDGIVAATEFGKEPADTKKIMYTSYGQYYAKAIRANIPFETEDFTPVGVVDDRSWILYVKSGTFADLNEIIEESKSRVVTLSGGGVGADAHLAFCGLINTAGGQSKLLSYEGGGEQKAALLKGEADVFVGTSQICYDEVMNGDVIPVACFTNKDYEGFEGIVVPNVADMGYEGNVIVGGGMLSVRTGADEATIEDVEALIKLVWEDEEYTDWIASIGLNDVQLYDYYLDAYIDSALENAVSAAKGLGIYEN